MKLSDPHKRTAWMTPEEWETYRAYDEHGAPRPVRTVSFVHLGRLYACHNFRAEEILAAGARAVHWLVRCGWTRLVDEGDATQTHWGAAG